ncbi:MAG: fumarylacetoacetate hydrolase family protein [Pseudomonadota bacterium]
MRLRLRRIEGQRVAEVLLPSGWKQVSGSSEVSALLDQRGIAPRGDVLPFLQLDASGRDALLALAPGLPDADPEAGQPCVPVALMSFRDFMLFEAHVINASRGMVRRLMPRAFPITRAFEAVTKKPFPKFKPHRLWYQQPIYYLSNHNTMLTEGDALPWPSYSNLLDYELELGAILAKPLLNASPDEAAAAIGGFVVLNDLSARDVQIDEMQSGFGPQKAKHFASAMSAEIVTADEVLPKLGSLTGAVTINGKKVADVSDLNAQFTLPEAIAFASRDEQLVPGELFGSGTLPGGAGMENDALIHPGDTLSLTIDGVGELTNTLSAPGNRA